MPRHTVQQGECLSSLGEVYGFFPETLRNHPDNADLKARRGTAHALLPGDAVQIPEKRLRTDACATGKRHVFRRLGVPARFQVRLLHQGEPRVGLAWKLTIDGAAPRKGTTDGDGWIRTSVPPGAQNGVLSVGDDDRETYDLKLGHLDPHDSGTGALARLRNLGYYAGDLDVGDDDEGLGNAIALFQEEQKLDVTGKMDDATRSALLAAHGS